MDDNCWFDEIGDRWESEGTDPGRIFEFYRRLSDDLHPGGMLETVESLPQGFPPKSPTDIKRIVVRHTDPLQGEIEVGPLFPIVLANFYNICLELM